MAPAETITVNGFIFCHDHGHELCLTCCYDHRMTNNIHIEDELHDLTESPAFDVEERLPRNVYALGAVAAVDTEESYQCEKHRTVDCLQCFNWVGIITEEAEAKEEQGGWLFEGSVITSGSLEVSC